MKSLSHEYKLCEYATRLSQSVLGCGKKVSSNLNHRVNGQPPYSISSPEFADTPPGSSMIKLMANMSQADCEAVS